MRAAAALSPVLVVAALAAAACGRSNPDPCRAREGLTCETLAEERALEQADFDIAVGAKDGDLVSSEGACVQALVTEQLERRCVADPCAELCGLHPCGVRDREGGEEAESCFDRCSFVVADNGIARAALDDAIVRAAARPGLCTCAICDEASQPLCDQLWVCAADALAE